MNEKHDYRCRTCGNVLEVKGEKLTPPLCCNAPMENDVSVCRASDTAEQSRLSDRGDPCDDGRSGK